MKNVNPILQNRLLPFLLICVFIGTALLWGCSSSDSESGMPAAEASTEVSTNRIGRGMLPVSYPVPATNPSFPAFPEALSPVLPRNIDQPFFENLKVDSLTKADQYGSFEVSRAKRLLDIFSWQTFIALNWPVENRSLLFQTDTTYQHAINCTDALFTNQCEVPAGLKNAFSDHNISLSDSVAVNPVVENELWELRNYFSDYWHPFLIRKEGDSLNVYSQQLPKSGLGDPGNPRWMTWKESDEVFLPDGSKPSNWYAREWPHDLPESMKVGATPHETHTLWVTHKAGILDESDQAGSGLPLWDQNGNLVFYEIRLNQPSFDIILKDTLYNLNGQIKFAQRGNDRVFFNWGNSQEANPFALGSMELKMAWKIIDESQGDIPERFITKQALVKDSTGAWEEFQVGLVGFHIAHKTKTHQSWIWSTFEHIDNLEVDGLSLAQNQHGQFPLKPLFHNISCATCPVNVKPDPDSTGVRKTQVLRVMPIPEGTALLNNDIRVKIASEAPASRLQYYELVGTQWPAAGTEDNGPIIPQQMVNTVMETYMQYGNREVNSPSGKKLKFETASCLSCHSYAKFASGCTIDNTGKIKMRYAKANHSADYSWLLNQANWYKPNELANTLCDPPA